MRLSQNLPIFFHFPSTNLYNRIGSDITAGMIVALKESMDNRDSSYISDWDRVSNPALKNGEVFDVTEKTFTMPINPLLSIGENKALFKAQFAPDDVSPKST